MFFVPEGFRIRDGELGTDSSYGNNGAFSFKLSGRTAFAIASDGEQWKPLKEAPELYEISNYGKVKALTKDVSIPNGAIRHHEETILKGECGKTGYPRVTLCINGKQKKYSVHVLVAETFIENPNNFPVVNHINGIRSDPNVMNLEWCTEEYNAFHAIENGSRRGLTAEQINQAKEMLEKGYTVVEISRFFGRSRTTITDIKFNRHRNLDPICPSGYTGIPLWEHVSVSFKDRTLTWGEMCVVKDMFWAEEARVMQLHPPKSEHINNHPFCLHLWRPVGVEIPHPDPIFVGIK